MANCGNSAQPCFRNGNTVVYELSCLVYNICKPKRIHCRRVARSEQDLTSAKMPVGWDVVGSVLDLAAELLYFHDPGWIVEEHVDGWFTVVDVDGEGLWGA